MNGSSTDPTAANYAANVAHNYGAPPITLVKGQGTLVWDAAGKRYLDFLAGIAVVGLGYCHPGVTAAAKAQTITAVTKASV